MSSEVVAADAKIQLDVLKYIKKIQSRNGVRDGQYIRYHQYCTRRLHRVRVALVLTTQSSKYKPNPMTIESYKSNQHLTVPLLLAERAWAYAMQMQADLVDLEGSARTKRRYHLVRRLAKAAKHADEFNAVCARVADEVTQLQATAYASWLKGTVSLEKEDWADALTAFNSAAAIFDRLGAVSDLEMAALCTERAAQIKLYQTFCSNKLKRVDPDAAALLSMQSGSHDAMFAAKIGAVLEASLKSQATAMQSIEWQGVVYKVKNEQTRVLLLEASGVSRQLQTMKGDSGDDEDMLDGDVDNKGVQSESAVMNQLLGLYDDVLISIRTDIREVTQAKVKTQVLEEGLVQLQGLQQYVSYLKAQVQLMKNNNTARVLRAKFHAQQRKQHIQPSSLVTVYDRLLQTVGDLFNSADVARNKALGEVLSLRKQGYTAVRVFYLALAYAATGQMLEAVALMTRSQSMLTQTIKSLKTHATATVDSPFTVTKDIATEVEQLECVLAVLPSELVKLRVKAIAASDTNTLRAQLDSASLDQSTKAVVHTNTNTPLLNRLDAFDAGISGQHHNLVTLPAPISTIPVKPFLFDLAANSIEYPDIASTLAHRAGSTRPGPSSAAVKGQEVEAEDTPQQAKSFWGRLWG